MQSKNKVAIIIVTYNVASLINKQIELIRKYCKDEFDIVVVNNSDNSEVIDAIKYYTTQAGVAYIKTQSFQQGGSDSHVFACNTSYFKLRDSYDYFLYLDHDNFPIREFSIIDVLGDKIIAGLRQDKSKTYFWPGCVMWNNRTIDKDLIDFSVSHELGLDTGGNLYRVIEKYGIDACAFFDEKYYENAGFRQPPYNFYATINDDMFMHFINASNWNPTDANIERVNSLINILEERTK